MYSSTRALHENVPPTPWAAAPKDCLLKNECFLHFNIIDVPSFDAQSAMVSKIYIQYGRLDSDALSSHPVDSTERVLLFTFLRLFLLHFLPKPDYL